MIILLNITLKKKKEKKIQSPAFICQFVHSVNQSTGNFHTFWEKSPDLEHN